MPGIDGKPRALWIRFREITSQELLLMAARHARAYFPAGEVMSAAVPASDVVVNCEGQKVALIG